MRFSVRALLDISNSWHESIYSIGDWASAIKAKRFKWSVLPEELEEDLQIQPSQLCFKKFISILLISFLSLLDVAILHLKFYTHYFYMRIWSVINHFVSQTTAD